MLIDVITRVAADTGYDLVQQRTALVRIAVSQQMHKNHLMVIEAKYIDRFALII